MSRPSGITVAEAAQILGLSRQQIHNLITQGRLIVRGKEPGFPGRGRIILDRASVTREAKRRKG